MTVTVPDTTYPPRQGRAAERSRSRRSGEA